MLASVVLYDIFNSDGVRTLRVVSKIISMSFKQSIRYRDFFSWVYDFFLGVISKLHNDPEINILGITFSSWPSMSIFATIATISCHNIFAMYEYIFYFQ
jgi:hypothetical protein